MKIYHTQTIYMLKSGKVHKMFPASWAGKEQLEDAERRVKYGLVQEGYLIEDHDQHGNAIFLRPSEIETAVVAVLSVDEEPDYQEPDYEELRKKWGSDLHLNTPKPTPSEPQDLRSADPLAAPPPETVHRFRWVETPMPQQRVRQLNDPEATQPMTVFKKDEIPEDMLRSTPPATEMLQRVADGLKKTDDEKTEKPEEANDEPAPAPKPRPSRARRSPRKARSGPAATDPGKGTDPVS